MFALEVKNLCKEYSGRLALDSVSFHVHPGSIHGFLGPNGAGKTTCMNIITNLLPLSSGDVLIEGKPHHEFKSRIGYLPEKLPLYDDMRVGEYLRFVFAIFEGKNPQSISKTIDRCGLGAVESQIIGTLSRGFRQRVAIAQALVHQPQIIILDEPTLGLDPVSNLEMRKLILDLKNDHTIFLSTHLLAEAEILCDELTLIHLGKVVVSDKTTKIKKQLSTSKKMKITAKNWNREKVDGISQRLTLPTLEFEADTLLVSWENTRGEPYELLKSLLSEGIEVQEFFEQRESLENIFHHLTKSNEYHV